MIWEVSPPLQHSPERARRVFSPSVRGEGPNSNNGEPKITRGGIALNTVQKGSSSAQNEKNDGGPPRKKEPVGSRGPRGRRDMGGAAFHHFRALDPRNTTAIIHKGNRRPWVEDRVVVRHSEKYRVSVFFGFCLSADPGPANDPSEENVLDLHG